jgi:hypothetical protein
MKLLDIPRHPWIMQYTNGHASSIPPVISSTPATKIPPTPATAQAAASTTQSSVKIGPFSVFSAMLGK